MVADRVFTEIPRAGVARRRGAGRAGRRVEHRPDPRPAVWSNLGDRGEGNRRRQHRHRGAVQPPRARGEVPRQPGPTAPSTTTTTGSTPPTYVAARRSRPATTTATARTPWARWSATMATGRQPDRRRPGREVDSRQGLRDQLLLRRVAARLRPVGVAPTDLNGANPRPDLAPHIVNNSWGGPAANDPWYQATVAGVGRLRHLPVVLERQHRPGLQHLGLPGRLPVSYSAGAFDINNAIASFSSRGLRLRRRASSRTSPRPASTCRSVPGRRLRLLQRHLDGGAARLRPRSR